MDDADRLKEFLDATAKRDLKAYAENFKRKLSRKMSGHGGRMSVSRGITVDEMTLELVVTDTIETRLSVTPEEKPRFDA